MDGCCGVHCLMVMLEFLHYFERDTFSLSRPYQGPAIRRSGYKARRQIITMYVSFILSVSVLLTAAVNLLPLKERKNVGSQVRHHGSRSSGVPHSPFHTPGFHIYYSVASSVRTSCRITYSFHPNSYFFQKACEAGLHAIIAGGMHSLQAKSLGYNAELYCVHGVCSLSIEVPLLYCITSKKTQKVYTKIFDHVKASIMVMYHDADFGFRKSSYLSCTGQLPEASIEGCAFHIAQAWNRKRNDLGLKKFTQVVGHHKSCKSLYNLENFSELKKYSLFVGVVSLSRVLIPRVKALQAPPVPTGHAAYETCEGLLSYFDADWLQGTFKDMWCKWKLEDLRYTNIAEAFIGETVYDYARLST
ncbi:hypothetical protein COOONC_20974 [Cooperia oncophora]